MRKNKKSELTFEIDSQTASQVTELYVPAALLELDETWQNRLTVVFRADPLGDDDAKLWQQLMLEAINALIRHPQPPEALLFYYRGVQLTLSGSPLLESLHVLEKKGSCLLVCATSLAAYTDGNPEIGRAVPFAELIEQMRRADKVIWL